MAKERGPLIRKPILPAVRRLAQAVGQIQRNGGFPHCPIASAAERAALDVIVRAAGKKTSKARVREMIEGHRSGIAMQREINAWIEARLTRRKLGEAQRSGKPGRPRIEDCGRRSAGKREARKPDAVMLAVHQFAAAVEALTGRPHWEQVAELSCVPAGLRTVSAGALRYWRAKNGPPDWSRLWPGTK